MGREWKTRGAGARSAAGGLWVVLAVGCTAHQPSVYQRPRPDVAPAVQPSATEPLRLEGAQLKPMYTEMLAVDLPAVVRVASARNFDIRRARQAVLASRGQLESKVGAAFPALVPTALFDHVEGTVRATEGDLVGVGFNTFQASVALQWVINPGRVVYDIIAAKKRLSASAYRERAVVLETLRRAVVQYYDLVLGQARIAAAHRSVAEAEELLRINRLRTRTGTGVPADELRAEARLAERRQDLVLAMRGFYDASVALAVTLHLEPAVTLVPGIEKLPPITLVRADLPIEELLDIAVSFRPDLRQLRMLLEAAAADRGATWWGAFGPQFQTSYQYGGIAGNANSVVPAEGIPGNVIANPLSATGAFSPNPVANGFIREGLQRGSQRLAHRRDRSSGFSDQQRAKAGVGWRLSVSAFGDLKSAGAVQEQAGIEAESQLDRVKAQVVTAAQAGKANHDLISLAGQQVAAADEALRLTEANLQAGTMTTLDVLQAQEALTQARFRRAEAVVRYNQSQVDLLAALGLLDGTSLMLAETEGE